MRASLAGSEVLLRRLCKPSIARGLITTTVIAGMLAQGDFSSSPRYDGAGYAVLARSLAGGTGYRAIDHPERPAHAHFPPGYPLLLAIVWRVTGPSNLAAHLVSAACTLGATLAAWHWFRSLYRPGVALLLGLALALNAVWTRAGSAILSEPLYMLLCQLAILTSVRAVHRHGVRQLLSLGGLLAACLLTRHVALTLILAILLDLCLRRRWRMALGSALLSLLLITPWLVWMVAAGARQSTQASLLFAAGVGLPGRAVGQALFYLQRIPDQFTGPVVELATELGRGAVWQCLANLWALGFSGIVIAGWLAAQRWPHRRLAGLVCLGSLALLLVWPYTEAGRFLIPLIPGLLIGTVDGISWLFRSVLRFLDLHLPGRLIRPMAAAMILAITLPYTGYSLATQARRGRDARNQGFDAACVWLAEHGDRSGPILTRHPGEVFLATGRQALEDFIRGTAR